MMKTTGETILIVEDDEGAAILENRALTRRGYAVTSVTNVNDALKAAQVQAFDLIVSDYLLESGTGLELLSKIRALDLETPVILVTGFSDEATVIEAMRGGAQDFVPKTAEYLHYLPEAVERVLKAVRMERELARSKARFQLFMDNTPAAAFIKDESGQLIYVNRVAQGVIGRKDWRGKTDAELWPAATAKKLREHDLQVLQGNKPIEILETMTSPSGEVRHFQTCRFPLREANGDRLVGGIAVDVTLQRATEESLRQRDEQLRQAQKMEAIGTLAGGVAHEFNNLLQIVLAYTRFAMNAVTESHQSHADLVVVESAAERAAQLTQQLLSFTRRESAELMPVNVSTTVHDLATMLRPLFGANITIELELDEKISEISADPTQLQQMLMNLCINARDAMPGGGRITISTSEMTIGDRDRFPAVERAGNYVVISVADTGYGVDAEVRQKIFEPFFTTKPVGKGTGLGLAVVYNSVKQHGGSIQVDSEPGEGTTFTIYLPSQSQSSPISETVTSRPWQQGRETILLAEDEPLVLEITKRMLEGQGYAVITASDGAAAIQLFRERFADIDLAILDVVMPTQSGWDTAQQIREMCPNLPIILMSGYDPYQSHKQLNGPPPRFIRKPFALDSLLDVVHEMIEEYSCPRI